MQHARPPPSSADDDVLDRVAPRLLAEARWRDRAQDEPTHAHEKQQRRDLYYYALGREHVLPPEWRGARDRAALEASSEYALYRALHARYGALSGQPLFPAPPPPAYQKEHKALEKLGLARDGAYAWLRSDAATTSGQAKRQRQAARKRKREAATARGEAYVSDSSDDEPSDGEPGPRRTPRLPRTQSARLVAALAQRTLPHRGAKRARLVTLADLPPSPDPRRRDDSALRAVHSRGSTTVTLRRPPREPASPPENELSDS